MSLAKPPRTRPAPAGIGAGRWRVGEIRVEKPGYAYCCPKQEEETLPPPVDSKDLFREASILPNRDDIQDNFGRVLQHRNNPIHHTQGFFGLKYNIMPAASGARMFSDPNEFREIVAEIRRALGMPTTGTSLNTNSWEVVLRLREALRAIESHETPAAQPKTVLEAFDGYVDSIDGDTAYVTLESRLNGDVLYGEYSAPELLARGICEQSRFLCETVKGGGVGRVHFAPLPKNQVTDEEARSIAKEMREAFPGDDDSVIEY